MIDFRLHEFPFQGRTVTYGILIVKALRKPEAPDRFFVQYDEADPQSVIPILCPPSDVQPGHSLALVYIGPPDPTDENQERTKWFSDWKTALLCIINLNTNRILDLTDPLYVFHAATRSKFGQFWKSYLTQMSTIPCFLVALISLAMILFKTTPFTGFDLILHFGPPLAYSLLSGFLLWRHNRPLLAAMYEELDIFLEKEEMLKDNPTLEKGRGWRLNRKRKWGKRTAAPPPPPPRKPSVPPPGLRGLAPGSPWPLPIPVGNGMVALPHGETLAFVVRMDGCRQEDVAALEAGKVGYGVYVDPKTPVPFALLRFGSVETSAPVSVLAFDAEQRKAFLSGGKDARAIVVCLVVDGILRTIRGIGTSRAFLDEIRKTCRLQMGRYHNATDDASGVAVITADARRIAKGVPMPRMAEVAREEGTMWG